MLIFAVDAGNTRTKWGLFDTDTHCWTASGSAAKHQRSALASQWAAIPEPGSIVISSVARVEHTEALLRDCRAWRPAPRLVKAQAAQCGVKNRYDDPGQLGSDRWAALIGARNLFPGRDILIVQSGTATTIDTLDADGVFLGGLILPGMHLMRQSLEQGTAMPGYPPGEQRIHPRNTADAIQSGVLNAIAGAIERRYQALDRDPLCLLSGGDADILLPLLQHPAQRVDDLVLQGLILIAQEGTK